MAKPKMPAADREHDAIRLALGGLGGERDIHDILGDLAPLHPRHDTFPGEVLIELAADALDLSGASRSDPLAYEGIRERLLPEVAFRGRADHQHSHYALRAVAMVSAGIEPDLLDELRWWNSDDFWVFAFYALVVYLRAAAERTGEPLGVLCGRIAARHDVGLSAQSI